HGLAANELGHVTAVELDAAGQEAYAEGRGGGCERGLVGGIDRVLERLQRDEAVERTAVEVMECQGGCHAGGDSALARSRRPIDGDDGSRARAHATITRKTAKKSGNVLRTQSGSWIVTGAPPNAASAKHIATRWSS